MDIQIYMLKDPAKLLWNELKIDVVVESTGIIYKNAREGIKVQQEQGW